MRAFVGSVAIGLGVFLLIGAARADIFRCVDRDGRSIFRDTPCPKGMRTTDVTTYVPAVQPEPEPQGPTTEELAALRRIAELEQEVAALRASLQAAQAAPAPVPELAPEPAYAPAAAVIVLPHRPRRHDRDRYDGDGRASARTPRLNPPG